MPPRAKRAARDIASAGPELPLCFLGRFRSLHRSSLQRPRHDRHLAYHLICGAGDAHRQLVVMLLTQNPRDQASTNTGCVTTLGFLGLCSETQFRFCVCIVLTEKVTLMCPRPPLHCTKGRALTSRGPASPSPALASLGRLGF